MKELLQSNEPYQVYFYTCPAHIPFQFARHPWVVTVSPSGIHRWEIIHRLYNKKDHFGYVYKNFYSNPIQGIKKHPNSTKYWNSTCIGTITGNENSLAYNMVRFIENNSKNYPYRDVYHFYPGPNSNTYIQWILDAFPEANIKLPWNCFGKKYQ